MATEMELAQKAAEADAALGVAHEALLQAQAAVLEPQGAVDLLTLAHEALDAADTAVEALLGLTGAGEASALRMDIREDFGKVGLKVGSQHARVPRAAKAVAADEAPTKKAVKKYDGD